jgi:AcrR family transcriptional regulator
MDRRQRKTRDAIFGAFTHLLSQKDFSQITVGEIIEIADVGRATFYAHFETKDYLLKAYCEELFCHIFDAETGTTHKHIFHCDGANSVFLHLFQHLQRNDNNILALLSSRNNELFLQYFRGNLKQMVESQLPLFDHRKDPKLPDSFWLEHIASTFTDTLKWWIENGMQETPETITAYFLAAV